MHEKRQLVQIKGFARKLPRGREISPTGLVKLHLRLHGSQQSLKMTFEKKLLNRKSAYDFILICKQGGYWREKIPWLKYSLMRSKQLGDTFKHFWQTSKYKEIVQFFLLSLDKMGKEMDEHRDPNSQLKSHRVIWKLCVRTLKKTLISYNLRHEFGKNQNQNRACDWMSYNV